MSVREQTGAPQKRKEAIEEYIPLNRWKLGLLDVVWLSTHSKCLSIVRIMHLSVYKSKDILLWSGHWLTWRIALNSRARNDPWLSQCRYNLTGCGVIWCPLVLIQWRQHFGGLDWSFLKITCARTLPSYDGKTAQNNTQAYTLHPCACWCKAAYQLLQNSVLLQVKAS